MPENLDEVRKPELVMIEETNPALQIKASIRVSGVRLEDGSGARLEDIERRVEKRVHADIRDVLQKSFRTVQDDRERAREKYMRENPLATPPPRGGAGTFPERT